VKKDYSIDLLANYGIPKGVIDYLKEQKYTKLTLLQYNSLDLVFKEDNNLIISAPTNTGKTFIAELAVIKNALSIQQGKCYFLFPLKALAEEKYFDLKERYQELGIRIAISSGDYNEFDNNLDQFNVVILTYEKLLSLVIKKLVSIENISLVVIDELQLLGDPERGAKLEILITILTSRSSVKARIVGLSATLNQLSTENIQKWLNAKLVTTPDREIELREGILYTGGLEISFKDYQLKKGDFIYKEHNSGEINLEKEANFQNTRFLSRLALEESFLMFYNTKNRTEYQVQEFQVEITNEDELNALIAESERVIEINPTFRRLKRYMIKGIGFYHAGMIPEERKLVSKAFNEELISILASTTGLGAGVNTPAQNVIFWDNKFFDERPFSVSIYKNMAGRAGRIGHDYDFGRSILIADSVIEMTRLWDNYIDAQPETINSQLLGGNNLAKYILSLLAADICNTEENLLNFIYNTLFGSVYFGEGGSMNYEEFEITFKGGIERYKSFGLIYEEDDSIFVTDLGSIIAKEGISDHGALMIYNALKELKNTDMNGNSDLNDLETSIIHLACSTRDAFSNWILVYYSDYRDTPILDSKWEEMSRYALDTPSDRDHFYRSIKTTIVLLDYISGESYARLRNKYRIFHGDIRNSALGLCWIITVIKKIAQLDEFDFSDNFHDNLDDLQDKLFFGAPIEALNILRLRLPIIHRNRAIDLATAGFRTIKSLIEASLDELIQVNGISRNIALTIHQSIENYIQNFIKRTYATQTRKIRDLGRDSSYITALYEKEGREFEKACTDIFHEIFGFQCIYCGEESVHGCDFYFENNSKVYAFECKRKTGERLSPVSAREAEEILGKSANFSNCIKITIGYPDFSKTAIENSALAEVTLLNVEILGEMIIEYWKGKLSSEKILDILEIQKYVVIDDIRNLDK